jgi:hypothetical protein
MHFFTSTFLFLSFPSLLPLLHSLKINGKKNISLGGDKQNSLKKNPRDVSWAA